MSVSNIATSDIGIDFDGCTTSSTPTREDEVIINFARLFFGTDTAESDGVFPNTRVFVVKDGAASASGCPRGRAVSRVLQLSEVEYDESVCIFTSKGAWAVAKFPSGSDLSRNVIAVDVTIFKP